MSFKVTSTYENIDGINILNTKEAVMKENYSSCIIHFYLDRNSFLRIFLIITCLQFDIKNILMLSYFQIIKINVNENHLVVILSV